MQRALAKLLIDRERLLTRTGQERSAIAAAFQNLRVPAAYFDRALDFGRFLRAHPLAVAGFVASIVVLRARNVLGAASRAFALWRLVRRVWAVAHRLGF